MKKPYPRLLVFKSGLQAGESFKAWRVVRSDTRALVGAFYSHPEAMRYADKTIQKFNR